MNLFRKLYTFAGHKSLDLKNEEGERSSGD